MTASLGEINPPQFIIAALLGAVVVGVVYNLWKTTRAYGGIIGQGLRLLGIGIIFFVLEALDRVIAAFTSIGVVIILSPAGYDGVTHDLLLMFGLVFAALGFMKFLRALKG